MLGDGLVEAQLACLDALRQIGELGERRGLCLEESLAVVVAMAWDDDGGRPPREPRAPGPSPATPSDSRR